jgi:hypothetical protein
MLTLLVFALMFIWLVTLIWFFDKCYCDVKWAMKTSKENNADFSWEDAFGGE